MMAQQSLEEQFGWCISTKDYLNDLNRELKLVSQQYRQSVDSLRAFGYIAENMPYLEESCNQFEENIDAMVSYVENEHIEYVQGQSETIKGELSRKFG